MSFNYQQIGEDVR